MPLIGTRGAGSSRGFGRFGGAGALYEFTSHTFTSAGIQGRTGPTLSQLRTSYSSAAWAQTSENFTISYTGWQRWRVPATATYNYTLRGARGQNSGEGASRTGTINLIGGEFITIIIGQMGLSGGSNAGGGGGGSFVFGTADASEAEPWLVAGGGGGRGGDNDGRNASNTTSGTNGNISPGGGSPTPLETGAGGTNGNGGNAGRISSGGGGWKTDGLQSTSDCSADLSCAGRPGFSVKNVSFPAVGGLSHTNNIACGGGAAGGQEGGFGCGGGAGYASGAGGGGYSGGGGSNGCSGSGGGGGSYTDTSRATLSSSGINTATNNGTFLIALA
jgi:hypothetical protein